MSDTYPEDGVADLITRALRRDATLRDALGTIINLSVEV